MSPRSFASYSLVLSAFAGWGMLFLAGPALFAQTTTATSAVDIQQTPIYQASVQQLFRSYCRPSSILWRDQPLKTGLISFQESQKVEVFLDRRIDSSQLVELGIGADRIDMILTKLAESIDCKLGYIESVAYLGPSAEVAKVELSYWRAWYQYRKQLIEAKAGGDQNRAPPIPVQKLKWDRLTTPQDILSSIEREWHIEIVGKEQVPHDLWDMSEYASLSLPAQICMVVAGFGLSAEPIPATNQWKLIPVREATTATLAYAKNQWKLENIERWSKDAELEINDDAKHIRVRAEVSEHYRLALSKFAAALPKPKSRFENLRFTFEAASTPASDVIDAVAVHLQLKTEWQIDRAIVTQRRINLKVNQASVKQLIDELAKQSGVTLDVIEERTLIIR